MKKVTYKDLYDYFMHYFKGCLEYNHMQFLKAKFYIKEYNYEYN